MKKLFLIILLATLAMQGYAQAPFEQRLQELDKVLNQKAELEIQGLNDLVDFDISNAPIQEFIGIIAASHGLNISVSPNLDILVTNRFSDAKVKDILLFLCRQHQLDITFLNNIISIQKWVPGKDDNVAYTEKKLDIKYNESSNQVDLNLDHDSLKLFTRQFTNLTGLNVIYSPDVREVRINAFFKNTPPVDALDQIAFANNLSITSPRDNFYVFGKPGTKKEEGNTGLSRSNTRKSSDGLTYSIEEIGTDKYVTATAIDVPIMDVINEISHAAEKEYFLMSKLDNITTLNVANLRYDEFLSYLLKATSYTYKAHNDIYLIGKRDLEGLRTAKIVKMKYRSIEEIDLFIPESMKTGVQIALFPELNAVILSGSEPQVMEIQYFLDQLDEPVPNILIEVIVVDVREGYSLQTGLNAFLGDSASAPQTTGRVFPGVDVTLGTDAINQAIEGLSKYNIINMGKVTPRFYATLKAIEDSNNIDIRSTPQLATLNGHEATLKIGESVFFVQQTQAINPGVNPITTISQQFRQVEANLSILIKPIVSGNEHITLSIDAEFSNFIPPEFENAPPGNATRRFTSMIRIKNEEMIVLGGLEEENKSENNTGVPLLSRVPILKWIFSSKSTSNSNNKLIIFIKPTIVF